MYETILVPTDGSHAADRAADHAIELAKETNATIHALYVMDMGEADFVAVPSDIADTEKRLRKKGEKFAKRITDRADEMDVSSVTVVKKGSPEQVIVDYADENGVDLIVMGKKGRRDPDKPFFGSTTRRVMGMTEVPVQAR